MASGPRERTHYDQDLRTVAKGTGLDLFRQAIQRLLALITAAVTARLLGVAGYGLLYLSQRVIALLSLLFRWGYPLAIVRYVSTYEGEGKRTHARGVVVGTVFTAVALAAPATAVLALRPDLVSIGLYQKPAMDGVLRVLALSLPAALLASLLVEATIAKRTMVYRLAAELLQRVVGLLGILALCGPLRLGSTGAAFALLLAWSTAALINLTGTVRLLGPVSFSDLQYYDFVQINMFALPLLLSGLFQYGLFEVNTVVGGRWLNASEVGMYGAASAVATFGLFGLDSVTAILRPIIADLHHRGKMAELAAMFQSATRWAYHLTIPLIVIVLFKAESILAVFRPEFVGAAFALRVLCIGQIVNVSVGAASVVLALCGRQWLVAGNNLTIAILNIVLCVTLTRSHRLTGLAVAATIATTGVNLLRAAEVWWLYRITAYTRKVFKPVLACIISCPLLLIRFQTWPLDLTVPVAAFAIAYVVLVLLIGLERDDREILATVRRRLSAAPNAKQP